MRHNKLCRQAQTFGGEALWGLDVLFVQKILVGTVRIGKNTAKPVVTERRMMLLKLYERPPKAPNNKFNRTTAMYVTVPALVQKVNAESAIPV